MSAAKVAADHEKPDGLVVVPPGEVADFLAPLDVETVYGVGPVTARQLRGMGIETAGDLAATAPATSTRSSASAAGRYGGSPAARIHGR